MAGVDERSEHTPEVTADIAADDVGVSAAAERVQKAALAEGEAQLSDGDRAMAAMASRKDRFAGSAVGVGSVGFGETGVFTSADGAVGEVGEDELLVDGQEEVFSRSEVERGRIEHHAGTDGATAAKRPQKED